MGRKRHPPNKRVGSVLYSPGGGQPEIRSIAYCSDADALELRRSREVADEVVIVSSGGEAMDALDRIEVLAAVIVCVSADPSAARAIVHEAERHWPDVPCISWSRGHERSWTGRVASTASHARSLITTEHRKACERRRAQLAIAVSYARAHHLPLVCRRFTEIVMLGLPEEDHGLWLGTKPSTTRGTRERTCALCRVRNLRALEHAVRDFVLDRLIGHGNPETQGDQLDQLLERHRFASRSVASRTSESD